MHWIIHGHFYQPPRENPWSGRIPRQPSAAPFHDWNERIHRECYRANAHSRILDARGRIESIVNNYEEIHFDFGPTLLRWIAREDPELHARILDADAASVLARGGHGNAIAQAYNHMILPLATDRDRRTQILWGLRDFAHRFGRRSESVWLPETACDEATLRLLVELEVRYVILAPAQAKRVRPLAGGAWTDVSGERIDSSRAYRATVRDRDGTERGGITVFFYDGPLSAGISFGHFLRSAPALADRLAARGTGDADLVQVATDGEVYGHHEPFGDMCLAYLTRREAPRRGVRVTNYGEHLDHHPPHDEVELDFGPHGAGSSWSCAHGIERWRSDCGCRTGGRSDWNQRWRGPLREALDALRDRLAGIYEEAAGALLRDPWHARDEAIDLLLDPAGRDRFLDRHARRPLDEAERAAVLDLLDSQHHAMLMFTSCAWFFADLAGLEVQQNLAYAARAIEVVQAYGGERIEREFVDRLA
ncbi:MAG: DUF3536 domain-containing protein, partial [Candidatus Latescibacteria bacterium]|nr:DUF3536 domain-containing protein [Candidatus Latescibacterota bacterium]